MTIDEIIDLVSGFDGVLVQRPRPGDGTPEIAWGDVFFFHAPDGRVPAATQPFATVVTKDYPGDEGSRLAAPDRFRLNIAVGAEAFTRVTGHAPRERVPAPDPAATDTLFAHPLYAGAGWLSVVNPGAGTEAEVRGLLAAAHARARAAGQRRAARG